MFIFISKLIIDTNNEHTIKEQITKSSKFSSPNISEELISEQSPKSISYYKNSSNARNNHFKINLQTNIGYIIKKKKCFNIPTEKNSNKDNCLTPNGLKNEIIQQSQNIINIKGNSNSPDSRNNLNNFKRKIGNPNSLKTNPKLKTCPSESNIHNLIDFSTQLKNFQCGEQISNCRKELCRKGTTIACYDKISFGTKVEMKVAPFGYGGRVSILEPKRRPVYLNPIKKKTVSSHFSSTRPALKITNNNRVIIK